MSIVGYKRAPSEDSPFVAVWRPTCELEDAALPPGEFIYGGRDEAYQTVLANHPAPPGTYRVKMADGYIQVATLPVVDPDLVYDLVNANRDAHHAASRIAAAVAACGKVLVNGKNLEEVKAWRALAKFPIEAAATEHPGRVTAIVPASAETLKRRAAAAKGAATKAAGASRVARERREARERADAAERKRKAVVEPVWKAQDAFREGFRKAIADNLEAKKLPDLLRSFALHEKWARAYRLIVGRSHRSRPDFKALMRLVDAAAPGADREAATSALWGWVREEYETWAARRGRARDEKPTPEAAPVGADAT